MAAWIWEIIRVRNYDRHNPPVPGLDWADPEFGPIFVLFILNWVSSSLWQYIILYFLGTLTNSPRKAANYAVSVIPESNSYATLTIDRVYSVGFSAPERPFALVWILSPSRTSKKLV